MNTRVFAVILFTSFWLAPFLGSRAAADWPCFRGPKGGVADDVDLPAQWTKDNVLWKVKLPGLGSSSPITAGDKVFVTCYSGYGTTLTKGFGGGGKGGFGGKGGSDKGKGGDKGKSDDKGKGGFDKGKGGFGFGGPDTGGEQKNLRLLLLCLERATGKILWQKDIPPKLPEFPFNNFNREHGYASSTPVTDGERVYVFFGKTGVLAFDLDGNRLWHVDVGSGTDAWGSAASPILYQDLLIVNAAIESQSLVALNKKSGKEVWRVKGLGKSWSTPVLVQSSPPGRGQGGKQELVVSLPGKMAAYDPRTGDELWHCEGIAGMYTISSPVARDGVVYAMGGGGPTPPMALAVRAGGRGDVTKTHVLWRKKAGTGISSPVLSGDHVCWVAGAAWCLKAADGETAYQERLYDGFGEYVSAVAAGDKIFALTRFDGLFVLAGGGKFQKLGHYDFEGDSSIFNASPAVSNGRLYIRSNNYFYCIGKKSGNP